MGQRATEEAVPRRDDGPPDAERGPSTGPRPDQLAAKLADTDNGTSTPPTVIGDSAHVLVLDAEVDAVLADRREVGGR